MAKRKKAKKTSKRKKIKRRRPKRKRRKKKSRPRKKVKGILSPELVHRTRMRVIGVGGGGGSIVSEIAPQVQRVDFIVANTDTQALKTAARKTRPFHFGQSLTHGLGCGMDAKLGQKAAKTDKNKIAKLFKGIDLCILVASLGGGTGSGAAPEFAKLAREFGVITFGIFTLPFKFEGSRRAQIARASMERLTPNLNTISTIPNENIFQIIDKKTPLKSAFSAINKRLAENLRGLIEMIYLPGLINIDFADLKTILDGKGRLAYLNSATAQGPNRSEEVIKQVLRSPLNEYSIQGAEKIIFNITASQDLGMKEVEHISKIISDFNRRAKIIFGISQDNSYKDKIRITLLAVGCGKKPSEKPKRKPKPKLKPEPKPRSKRKSKPRRKRKPKPKPKPKKSRPKPKPKSKPKKVSKKKVARKQKKKIKPVLESSPQAAAEEELNLEVSPINRMPARRNALDLKKAAEKTEEEMMEQESKWDIPAFLRRKENR